MDSDTERGTPAMWSSFHAARPDAVGQQEKSIEAIPEMIRHGMELVKKTTEHLNPHQIPVLVVH